MENLSENDVYSVRAMYDCDYPTALRRCPFCGSKAVVYEDDRYADGNPLIEHHVYGVMCTDEGCIAHSMARFFRTESAAIIAWNKRNPFNHDLEGTTKGENSK